MRSNGNRGGQHAAVITDRITLWPANYKYETISLSDLVVSVSDNCANLTVDDVVITKVTSDEEAQGGGDGNTLNDIAFPDGCSSVDLRAERRGGGNGRVYTFHLAVADGNGNQGTATCIVQVPHDKKDTAVDDGTVYEIASGSLPKRIGNNHLVSDQQTLPEGYALLPNHPNPFNPTTEITYTLPKDSDVGLMIFNLSGQLVRILDAGQRSAGVHTVQWNATDDDGNRVASGVYLVVFKAGHFMAQQRMVFMK